MRRLLLLSLLIATAALANTPQVQVLMSYGESGPSVNASGVLGQSNISPDPTESYSGIRFLTDGTWETMNNNASSATFASPEDSGTWLTSGDAAEVWLQRSYSAGTFDTDAGAGCLQLNATRTFYEDTVGDPAATPQTVTATFTFYDDSGCTSSLDATSALSYTATRTP